MSHSKPTTDTPTHNAQSEEYLGKLNAITGRLAGSFPGEPLGREDVARVVMELLQGQEETLGANSPSPRPMVKLSMRHWQDYTPGGSLFMIVRRCVRFKLKKGLRRFDWQSEHKRAEFVGMLGDCAEELREKGLLGHVKVYISGDVPVESRDAIKAAARSMGAVLAASASDAAVTHVLHADLDANGTEAKRVFPDKDQAIVRGVVEKEALVHYAGYPESYDAWCSVSTAREHAAKDRAHRWDAPPADDSMIRAASGEHLAIAGRSRPAKHVHYTWIVDSVKYNEWCEEDDYAWEDPAETAMRAATRARDAANAAMAATTAAAAQAQGGGAPRVGEKRKGGPDAAADDASQGTVATHGTGGTAGTAPAPPPEVERVAPPQFAERIGPSVVRQHLTAPHSSVAAAAANDGGARADPHRPGRPAGDRGVVQENISRGQMAGAAGDVAKAAAAVDAAVADVTDVTDEGIDADANGSDDAAGGGRDREPYKIPGHSHWFRWDATHELERRGVPEFFEGRSETKTPEAYSKIRAAMMNQYRAAKKAGERLSFTKARRGLVGDVNSLQRVFDFLERWGLINWQPRIDAEKAAGLGANVPRVVAVDVARPEKPDPGTFSAANVALYRFPPAPLNGAATSVAEAEAAAEAAELAAEQTGARRGRPPTNPRPEQPAPAALRAPLSAYAVLYGNQGNVKRNCVGCDADITGKGTAYYHCARPPPRLAKTSIGGVDVCGRCFSAGKLPDGTTSGSFLRTVATVASSKKAKKARVLSVNEDGEEFEEEEEEDDDDSDAEMEQDDWTDQETLLLLEALETHGESWSEVASHVGTKSAEECIRRFIRLPIEERVLDELDPNVGGEDAADVRGGGDVGSTEVWRMGRPDVDVRGPNDLTVPFAGAPNPVMSNVAFLATCVTPRVAAAAAKAALHALDEENKETEKGGDAMDVDGGGGGGEGEGERTAADVPVTDAGAREAAATGLAAAAVRAKLLADAEEREVQRLIISIAEAQMKKIEAKMRSFEDLEIGLTREREAIEEMKARLFAERADLRIQKLEHEESVARAKEAQERREATTAN